MYSFLLITSGRKKKSCVLISLPTILVAICFIILFLVFEFYPPISGQTILQASDVVRLSSHGFDPFHYTTVTVTRNDSKTPVGDASRVKFYLQACSKLVPSHRPIRTKVTHIDSSSEDHTFFVYQGYLLKGSNISFDVNITAHTEFAKCSAALNIFQDYECFGNFLNFGSDVNDCSTRRTCLHISSTLDQQPPYVFTADETSYYFVALSAPSGTEGVDDIYFQTTGMQLYYTTDDLPPDCSMITGINSSCSLSLPGSQAFQVSLGNTVCVLAVMMADSTDTTTSENNTVTTYLTYSSTTAHNPAHNIVTLVLSVAITIIFIVVTVVVFCICCSKCRFRDHHYQELPTDLNPVH